MFPTFSFYRADDKYNPAFALPFRKQWILNLSTGMRTSKKLIDTFAKFRNRSTEKVNKRGFCNDSAPLPAGSAGTGLDANFASDNVQSIIVRFCFGICQSSTLIVVACYFLCFFLAFVLLKSNVIGHSVHHCGC